MSKALDLTGQKFERLLAIEPTEKRNNDGCIIWKCLCDCGKIHCVSSKNLKNKTIRSCGCSNIRRLTHGMAHTAIYKIWTAMLQRCENPKSQSYKNYGGRGITVCECWHTFENFYADIGECPKGLTLERIDNEKGYYPKNCCWDTRKAQANNQRDRKNLKWFFAFNLNTGDWNEDNNQVKFAQRHRLLRSSICDCLRGKLRQHQGWIFERI